MTAQHIAPVIPPSAVPAAGGGPGPRRAAPCRWPARCGPSRRTSFTGSPASTPSGRICERAIITALGWAGGDRLTLTAEAGVVTARRDPGGMVTLPASAYITIPAALRRRCGLEAGDQVLLAALPGRGRPRRLLPRRRGPGHPRPRRSPARARRKAMTTTPASPAAPQQAAVDAALVVLKSMGLTLEDLAAPGQRPDVPTFAEYVPVVSAAVTDGTRKAYGSYWNRVVEQWGSRRLDEPTPSEIKQLVAYVRANTVPRRNARGGRSAAENLIAALRCLYRQRRGRRAHRRAGQPGPQGGQAPPSAVHPPGRQRHQAGGDQPDRRHHRRRPRTRHADPATAHRDRLPPRRRARPAPGRPGPRAVPDPAPGKGRDGPLAASLPHAHGRTGSGTPRNATPRRTGGCCATPTDGRSPTGATTACGSASAGTCPGSAPSRSAPTGSATPP